MEIPKYIKCKKVWRGANSCSNLEKVYNTDIPNTFSRYTWQQILTNNSAGNKWDDYFTISLEEKWNRQEGITKEIIANNYEIY